MNDLKETIEDNTGRINSLETEVNFLLKELAKVKSAKVILSLEIDKEE